MRCYGNDTDRPLWESQLRAGAEGATAPESLRQKDRFGFCDTLESACLCDF